jgi:hypothetical protein
VNESRWNLVGGFELFEETGVVLGEHTKVFPLNTQPQLLAGSFPIDPTNPTTDQW